MLLLLQICMQTCRCGVAPCCTSSTYPCYPTYMCLQPSVRDTRYTEYTQQVHAALTQQDDATRCYDIVLLLRNAILSCACCVCTHAAYADVCDRKISRYRCGSCVARTTNAGAGYLRRLRRQRLPRAPADDLPLALSRGRSGRPLG